MAARSLGSLTLDLVARIGGFVAGLSQAEREADKRSKAISKRARDIEKAWSDVGKTIAAGFAGITIGAVFGKFIQESRDAQNEQAQLAAVLRSTGEAAGYTQGKLNDMATALSQNSIFDDGDINKAQTRLLSYTNVVGEQFPQALQAAIDMASRLGISLEQSAETIGKALDVPSQGLTALSKQGFKFSEDQKKVIERLEQTGRTAEAQGMILEALNTAYGGAGKAARDTFGGAIAGLQNQLNSLMTGEDGSLQGATDAVNDLAKTLGSAEVRAAFNSLVQGLALVITKLGEATTEFINFGRFSGEALARFTTGSADPIERLDDQMKGLRDEAAALNAELNRPKRFIIGGSNDGTEELRTRLQGVNQQLVQMQKTRDSLVKDANNPSKSITNAIAPLPKPGNVGGGGAKGKDPYAEAQRFLESLQKQLLKTQELSVAEAALAEIRSGRLGLVSKAQEEEILRTARQIDAQKALAKETEESNKRLEEQNKEVTRLFDEAKTAIQSVETPLETYNRKLRENAQLAKDNPFINGETIERLNMKAWDDFSGTFEKINTDMEKGKNIADELGMSFSSAFEDAISKGGSLRDIIQGLEQDIIRLVTRELVTKPFSEAITGWAKGFLGGAGGGFMGPQTEQALGDSFAKQFSKYLAPTSGGGGLFSGIGSFFSNLFSFDGGGFTGSGPRAGGLDGKGGFMAMLHPNETVSDHTKGQGRSVVINVGVEGQVDQRTRNQIGAEVALQLQRAERNL